MARWISVLLIVTVVGGVGAVSAQQAPAPPAADPAMGERTVEGKVEAVDQAKKQVTLEDGTSFTVPATAQVEWATITPGQMVSIPYMEAGPLKTVRKMEVKS